MTYCLALKLDGGIVLASDSRTNAGVDNVSVFCKMRLYESAPDRWIGTVCSGHLGITQGVWHEIDRQIQSQSPQSILCASSMHECAQAFGNALWQERDRQSRIDAMGVDTSANFLVAGQIGFEPPRLFMIYAQGNFIEAQEGTCCFQIGETKYGKPILDRVVDPQTSIEDAIKCALVSFDSTMRSNLSVGAPVDVAAYRTGSFCPAQKWRFSEQDPYFSQIRQSWSAGLRQVFANLPNP